MSGEATGDAAAVPRVLVRLGARTHDVFEVLGLTDGVLRARTSMLFEIGESLALRIEQDGTTTDAIYRVRAHVGTPETRVTELELLPAR